MARRARRDTCTGFCRGLKALFLCAVTWTLAACLLIGATNFNIGFERAAERAAERATIPRGTSTKNFNSKFDRATAPAMAPATAPKLASTKHSYPTSRSAKTSPSKSRTSRATKTARAAASREADVPEAMATRAEGRRVQAWSQDTKSATPSQMSDQSAIADPSLSEADPSATFQTWRSEASNETAAAASQTIVAARPYSSRYLSQSRVQRQRARRPATASGPKTPEPPYDALKYDCQNCVEHWIVLLGMFSSGTNLMYDTIASNFPICRQRKVRTGWKKYLVPNLRPHNGECIRLSAVDKHANPYLVAAKLANHSDASNHHSMDTRRMQDYRFNRSKFEEFAASNAQKLTVISMVRNPLSQMLAWKKTASDYDLKECILGATRKYKTSTAWLTASCNKSADVLEQGCGLRLGYFSSGVPSVWNTYTQGYLELSKLDFFKAVEIVRYEDLVVQPEEVVNRLGKAMGLQTPEIVTVIENKAKSHGHSLDRKSAAEWIRKKEYMDTYTKGELSAACEGVDIQLSELLEYDHTECNHTPDESRRSSLLRSYARVSDRSSRQRPRTLPRRRTLPRQTARTGQTGNRAASAYPGTRSVTWVSAPASEGKDRGSPTNILPSSEENSLPSTIDEDRRRQLLPSETVQQDENQRARIVTSRRAAQRVERVSRVQRNTGVRRVARKASEAPAS